MRFYICFGILLCFICIITGMPSSGGSTSNNQGDSSGVNNNEDPYPISTHYSNYMRNAIYEMVNNNKNTIGVFLERIKHSPKITEEIRKSLDNIIESIINSDNKTDAINEYTEIIRNMTKNDEEKLEKELCAGDLNNNDTITQNYAKKTLLKSPFFINPKDSDPICEFLIKKNLNSEHQVLYKDLLKNFGTNMQEYENLIDVEYYEDD